MMRKLYLVPIIHASPDMGSLASALEQRASAELGQELWRKHKEVVSAFWDSVDRFFASLDVKGFKIYQDGLIVDGAEGLRIIGAGISRGSKNYEIIGKLLERGAILIRTEKLSLVKEERDYITKMAQAKSPREKESAALRYKLAQSRLLRERDNFIAGRIKETFNEGETGILFIGASHDILTKLLASIQVIPVKDIAKVRGYHKTIATSRKYDQHLHQLALYLTSPISSSS